jgi:hypothetical protein
VRGYAVAGADYRRDRRALVGILEVLRDDEVRCAHALGVEERQRGIGPRGFAGNMARRLHGIGQAASGVNGPILGLFEPQRRDAAASTDGHYRRP